MIFTKHLRLKSTVPSLFLIIFLCANVGLGQQPTLKATASALQKAGSNGTISHPIDMYYGTVKFEMRDGTYITPFGVDVILKQRKRVVMSVSTNNSGRYYLKNLKNGRYQRIVQHKNATVFTDFLIITSSTANKLKDIIIANRR